MLDLAWALAIDLPRGGAVDPLLDGYGRDAVDAGALDRLLPLMMARRLADVPQLGFDRVGAGWLAEWLDRHAPRCSRSWRRSWGCSPDTRQP